MKTLVLNSGSSSIKYSLFDLDSRSMLISGLIEKIGEPDSLHRYEIRDNDKDVIKQRDTQTISNHRKGLQTIFSLLSHSGAIENTAELRCIGHRVVHGGERFVQPIIIDTEVIAQIREMIPLAPLHNPANLLGIEQAIKQVPDIPQIAVFDTAFHHSLPPHAYHYAVPSEWYRYYHVRRYGFHGTSHYYVAKRTAEFLKRKLEDLNLITLHLGNGASITAIEKGKSIDTSMGMTPLEGLIMGTRCGDIDPALPFYLQRTNLLSFDEIETRLNKHSGLKGICGENDMRNIHKLAENGDETAQLALSMFAYRIKKYLGAYFAALGHVDAIVFTGGIGENDNWLRQQCCSGLKAFGISIDPAKNNAVSGNCCSIGDKNQAVDVLVIKTNEELEIALQAIECLERCE